MKRYVMTNFRGTGTSAAELDRITGEIGGVRVIDRENPKLRLIEATDSGLEELKSRVTGWTISAEHKFSRPETGARLHRPLKTPFRGPRNGG